MAGNGEVGIRKALKVSHFKFQEFYFEFLELVRV